MGSFETRTLRCDVCGKPSQLRVLLGYQMEDMGLDQKPEGRDAYHMVLACPHCGYAAENISAPVNDSVREYVLGESYQSWRRMQKDDILAALEGASYAAARGLQILESGRYYLEAAWYCEDTAMPERARENRSRYIQLLQRPDAPKITPPQMIMFIDSLRQLGQFQNAIRTIGAAEAAFQRKYGQEHLLYRILMKERTLAARADAQPHLISEVL